MEVDKSRFDFWELLSLLKADFCFNESLSDSCNATEKDLAQGEVVPSFEFRTCGETPSPDVRGFFYASKSQKDPREAQSHINYLLARRKSLFVTPDVWTAVVVLAAALVEQRTLTAKEAVEIITTAKA